MIINGRGKKKRKNIFLTFIIYYKLYLYLFTSSLYQYPESIFTSSLFCAVFLLHFMHCVDCFYFYYTIWKLLITNTMDWIIQKMVKYWCMCLYSNYEYKQ